MGPASYMQSVVFRNVLMRHMTCISTLNNKIIFARDTERKSCEICTWLADFSQNLRVFTKALKQKPNSTKINPTDFKVVECRQTKRIRGKTNTRVFLCELKEHTECVLYFKIKGYHWLMLILP